MARIVIPGLSVHLIRRGNNRCAIYGDDDDRRRFLAMLQDAATRYGTAIHAFVQMTTHYHAIVTPDSESSLPNTMKKLGEDYVEYFNGKYGRIGTLWSGTYRAIPIPTERYWLNCLRYIEQNPVRAGMVAAPGDFSWSSYATNALGEPNELLTEHHVYRALGSTPEERQAVYRAMCGVALTEEELGVVRRPATRIRARLAAAPVAAA